ncbi:MAG: 50S ribosome-binding GTPase [Firmicutes bacterium]|nr:50S ribosome-binding GTPase [Bacillota bacterium]
MKKDVKKDYEILIDQKDEKINVLVMGASGCGKSTLINAILQENLAQTGIGKSITKDLKVYENTELPFRLIDTVGFEFGFFKQQMIKRKIDQWGKDAVKSKKSDKLIHAIWFCVDGTVKRVSTEVLDYIRNVSKSWKDVPILIVFTKSYSSAEIEENEQMMRDVLDSYKRRDALNVQGIVSVVAKSYQVNDQMTIPPMGLDTLIEKTNHIMPEAVKIAKGGIKDLDIKIKRNMTNSVIFASTTAATVVGAVPIPFPDATILVPIQIAMLQSVSKTYKMDNEKLSNEIIDTIIKVGGTTMVAKTLLNTIKAIPGIGIGAAALNAIVAGVITFATGKVSAIVFERVYKGDIDFNTIDWDSEIGKLFKDTLPDIIRLLAEYAQNNKNFNIKDLAKILFKMK